MNNSMIEKNDKSKMSEANISVRMGAIKTITDGKYLKTMISVERNEGAESFQKKNIICKKGHVLTDGYCNDIRCILDKKLLDITKVISDLGVKLIYVKSGSTGHTFKGVSDKEFAIKVVAFPKKEKYGNFNDARRPENAELLMIKVLSYFVINNHTPHIVLPISTFNAKIDYFIDLFTNKKIENKKYASFVRSYGEGQYYDWVSILISEWANGGDLLDYIRNNYKTMTLMKWKILLFQILSVLAVIQKKYPTFRHNDLKANNILIHNIKLNTANKPVANIKYTITEQDFIIPNMDFQIKIWDFDFSSIPGIVDNAKVCAKWTDEINVTPEGNKYYDIHYFLNTLIRPEFFEAYKEEGSVPQEIKDFINRVVPDKYKADDKTAKILKWLKNTVIEKYKKTEDKKDSRYAFVKDFLRSTIPDKCKSSKESDYFKVCIDKIIPAKNKTDAEYDLIREFIERIETDNYVDEPQFKIITDKGRILINTEYTTPYKILIEDPLFTEFRVKKKNII